MDNAGRPVVVFHGTGHSFDSFDTSTSGLLGYGAYFTSCPTDASEYAYAVDGGEQVIPVYLRMERPVRVDASEGWPALYKMVHGKTPRNADDEMPGDRQAMTILKQLMDWGHDGIISTGISNNQIVQHYVAFHPEQIKSAIGNSGRFDFHSSSIIDVAPPRIRHKLRISP